MSGGPWAPGLARFKLAAPCSLQEAATAGAGGWGVHQPHGPGSHHPHPQGQQRVTSSGTESWLGLPSPGRTLKDRGVGNLCPHRCVHLCPVALEAGLFAPFAPTSRAKTGERIGVSGTEWVASVGFLEPPL